VSHCQIFWQGCDFIGRTGQQPGLAKQHRSNIGFGGVLPAKKKFANPVSVSMPLVSNLDRVADPA
jgi:hypothetical protein